MRPAILVTGGSGQVGTGIARANLGRFDLVMPARAEFDLGTAVTLDRDIAAIINCAAYTAVDKAESEPDIAFAINAEGPGRIADAAAARGIPLLHVSTDYVFDGTKPEPYVEDDPVAPLGVYGASKEAGERAVRAAGGRHLILRTAWVVSPWGHNFVKTMLRLGRERGAVRVVTDQRGCPTSAEDIAEALLHLAERMIADPGAPGGTYHFVNKGEATWYDLAVAVLAGRGVEVTPTTSAEFPTPARRPANSRLCTRKLEQDYHIHPRPWQTALDAILKELDA